MQWTSSLKSFEIGFKSSFNRLLLSKIVAEIHQNRCDDLNLDSDFELGFDLYRKLVEYNRKLLKKTKFLIQIVVFDII